MDFHVSPPESAAGAVVIERAARTIADFHTETILQLISEILCHKFLADGDCQSAWVRLVIFVAPGPGLKDGAAFGLSLVRGGSAWSGSTDLCNGRYWTKALEHYCDRLFGSGRLDSHA
jgi:hypothetical protein